MKGNTKLFLSVFASIAVILGFYFYIATLDMPVLKPSGLIAAKEKNLIIITTLLMLIVVLPVFFMTIFFAWKYRESNKKARYEPDWDYSHLLESLWWGIPCVIIVVLSVITWVTTHELSPYKPIASDKKPLKIQVVALDWKWLFIYPEYQIATINQLNLPIDRPVSFELTSDAPMNSFWIPDLSGQIYCMPAMRTQLHIVATKIGSFRGCSAQLSGKEFAGMFFRANVTSENDFNQFVKSAKNSPSKLSYDSYKDLAMPSKSVSTKSYVLEDHNLFEQIINKYLVP